MAEPACLRRSFSQPSETSHELEEGDPLRALGESISLGRYMSESLAWEKWSTFSHNRYLEEAEKYSKPGSVAKMKAYFEAHYNKIGAKKQAVEEQANNDSSSVEIEVQSTNSNLSSLNTESTIATSCTTTDEFTGNEGSNVELLSSVIVSSCESSTPITELQVEEVNMVESAVNVDTTESCAEVQVHQCKDTEVNVSIKDSFTEMKLNQCKDAPESDAIVGTPERELPVKMEAEKGRSNLRSKQKLTESSLKRSLKGNVSKLSSSFASLGTSVRSIRDSSATPNKRISAPKSDTVVGTPKRELPVKVEAEKGRSDFRSKQKLTESALKRSLKGNVSKLSSSFSKLGTPVCSERNNSATPNNRKSAKESLEEQKPISRLVHKSINCDVDRMKKSSPASRKSAIGKVFTPLGKIIRDRFDPSPAPSRASVKSCSLNPSATPQSEIRSNRSRIALEESFARSRTLDQKFQSSSAGKINSSVQSSTTFSAFSFRTEERAAKRREFLEKRLEKEAENLLLLDKAKVKQKTETRKSSVCVNLKAHATLDIRSDVLSDKTKKIAPSQMQLPRCRNKPAPELPQGTFSRPPQKSTSSKLHAEKSKPIPTQSSTLLTTKKRHENASPNIL